MISKEKYISNLVKGEKTKISLMIMRVIYKDPTKTVCIMADKTGEMKVNIPSASKELVEGKVLELEGIKDINFDSKKFSIINEYNIEDYLPAVGRPIEEIMMEIEEITNKYIISEEARALNDYFFKNSEFLDKFKRGIGGVSMHHNYIGGLAEHTLNVMYLSAMLCDRYECRKPEVAVLAAKLHDIGKIYELYFDGPFKYTLRGEMEGHILIGVQMIDEAVKANPEKYSEEFVNRIKGCITQHHGTLEFGSPRPIKMEESFIVNYADSIDATMNKVAQLKEKTEEGTWSEYDRRIDTKLFL